MADPLAPWWVHTAGVRRLVGAGAAGDVYDPPVPADPAAVTGFYRDGAKLVRTGDGEDTVSSGQFSYPRDTPPVPVGSLFITPPEFGGRVTTVIVSSVADGGGNPTPDHQTVAVQ